MIQIGFCDDDPSVLDELHELLGSYRTEHNAGLPKPVRAAGVHRKGRTL